MDIEEIKEAFLEEAQEYLDILKNNLRTFEGNFPNCDYEKITETYRAAHSIKGTAGFLALINISSLAKAIEYKMMPFRDKEKEITLSDILALQNAVIFLEQMINDIENSEDYNINSVTEPL